MEAFFHYGNESEQYLQEFERKRADYSIQEVTDFPIEELKALFRMFKGENRTFAELAGGTV